MGLTEFLVEHITNLISSIGYIGVAILMALESMIAPIPSEAVMPFAGFLIAEEKFTFTGVIFFSTLGSIIGSLLSYYMGAYGGRPLVNKLGKYLLLDQHHLELTERFFGKYGSSTIFISRFIPVIRHLISIPAGIGRMNLIKFSVYTIIGAGLWNAFLTYIGYHLRDNWHRVKNYSEYVDLVVLVLLLAVILFLFFHYRKKMHNKSGTLRH
jgi:membrane protein DedA with SNARE-associated domain